MPNLGIFPIAPEPTGDDHELAHHLGMIEWLSASRSPAPRENPRTIGASGPRRVIRSSSVIGELLVAERTVDVDRPSMRLGFDRRSPAGTDASRATSGPIMAPSSSSRRDDHQRIAHCRGPHNTFRMTPASANEHGHRLVSIWGVHAEVRSLRSVAAITLDHSETTQHSSRQIVSAAPSDCHARVCLCG